MTWVYETKTDAEGTTASVEQNKYESCITLCIYDNCGRTIKHDTYLTRENARRAADRYFKNYGVEPIGKWERTDYAK